ncbi:MAG: hypothetical protein IT462_01250 [Planctomycetes bacterium]|nr:hypothetical protein [Planctomycetota bacterium]
MPFVAMWWYASVSSVFYQNALAFIYHLRTKHADGFAKREVALLDGKYKHLTTNFLGLRSSSPRI